MDLIIITSPYIIIIAYCGQDFQVNKEKTGGKGDS